MLIGDIPRLLAAARPRHVAVTDSRGCLSASALDLAVNRQANRLLAEGVSAGRRIGICGFNSISYAVSLFALARIGGVACHFSARASASELGVMMRAARVERVLADVEMHPRFADSGVAVEALSIPADGDARPPATPVDGDAPYCITFTGGTTGQPKGVMVSHRARVFTAFQAALGFGLGESDSTLVATPLFHIAGQHVCFLPALAAGSRTVLLPRWDAGAFLDLAEREEATATFLVPTQIGDFLRHAQFRPERLAKLRCAIFAGAPMAQGLLAEAEAALPWVEFIENYGQSEAGAVTVRRGRHGDKKAAVGRPLMGVELRVVDSHGRSLPTGQAGEVLIRSPGLMLGYDGDAAQTGRAIRDGWLWTGDIGRLDEDGFLYLIDRSKDMIISGGENIYPAEIENALFGHPAVAECAAFGIPDERLGEVPAAHVVARPGAVPSETELIDAVSAAIARHKRPRRIVLVQSLPRTAVGKIQRHVIRAEYWRGRDRQI